LSSSSFIIFIIYIILSTLSQKKKKVVYMYKRCRSAALCGCPQVQGDVVKVRIVTPKKPNSARRPVVKASLTNKKGVVSHIPGIGHNLRKHSDVLIRGGGSRDLPGVRHTCIRGVYDFMGVKNKTRRRSIYGVKRPETKIIKIRRKFRKAFN
jgi:small subunit ribosomal protein S12